MSPFPWVHRARKHVEFLRTVIVRRFRGRGVVGQQRVRHVLPQEILERADLILDDRILGIDHEAELAGESAEPEGVAGAAGRATVVPAAAAATLQPKRGGAVD